MWSSFLLILSLIATALFGACASAQSLKQDAIDASKVVSAQVQKAAEFIDLTLAGKKYTDARNESQVTLGEQTSLTEGGVWQNAPNVGLNLRLPNTEKEWQARFSTVDEESEDRDMNQRLIGSQAPPQNPGAALLFFQKLGEIRTTFQPRVELKNPLEVDYVLKFASTAQTQVIRIEPSFELYADANKGTGEYLALNFFTKLKGRWQFSEQNEEEYYESGNTFSTRHGVTADYRLTDTQDLGWATVLSSLNHDFHLDSVNLSISYSHQIIKRLLRYSLSPFLGFAKANDFKGKAGFMISLQMTI